MTGIYRIFGSEMSPYSVKVRSYFRYKNIAHQWVARTPAVDGEYKKYAKLPIVPTVATPEGEGLQDSTPIMEAMDGKFPEPSIHPADADLKFLSDLIEEFGDEWGNKLMFHHRWWDEIDRRASARTLARLNLAHGTAEEINGLARMIEERMSGRGGFVGSNAATAPLISRYYFELLDILEPHFAMRKYLFGARPAFGDFGLAAQLYEASIDPTCGGIIRARGAHVLDWCYRMIEPRNDGAFENWNSLKPTMEPLLRYVGRYFLPWSAANAAALQSGAKEFSVELEGESYTQSPQKYHAKSLAMLKAKYKEVAERPPLIAILKDTGCLRHLA